MASRSISPLTGLTFILAAIGLFAFISLLMDFEASGHGVTWGIQSKFFREEDETYSSDRILVDQDLKISGKLVSLSNETLNISIFIFDGTDNVRSNWKILNIMPNGTVALDPNDTVEFAIELKALKEGIYHLHPVFHWDNIGPRMGPGQAIIVFPESITSYDLVVDDQKFNLTYVLHKNYNLDTIELNKSSKSLVINLSAKGIVIEDTVLGIWVPNELIQNVIYREDSIQPNSLELRINGKASEYLYALLAEDYGLYGIRIPPSSFVTVEMTGTQVIPEFPINLIAVTAVGLIGMLIALRLKTKLLPK